MGVSAGGEGAGHHRGAVPPQLGAAGLRGRPGQGREQGGGRPHGAAAAVSSSYIYPVLSMV